MSIETCQVILHIDETKAPLEQGQEFRGTLNIFVLPDWPLETIDATLYWEDNSYSISDACSIQVSPRIAGRGWAYFQAGNEIAVNVKLTDWASRLPPSSPKSPLFAVR